MFDQDKIIIAIDGYSSCGKSSFAKSIAKKLDYIYVDTGAMYRAITLFAIRNGLIKKNIIDEVNLRKALPTITIKFVSNQNTHQQEINLNNENVEEQIRKIEVANAVSILSQIGFAREKMVELQRNMGKHKGIVMDGRDIGTVVFPEAEIKIFMTASPNIRAQRRYDELIAKGQQVQLEEIKANLIERDRMDTTRTESPLKQSEDALVLDNSQMTPEQQMEWFVKIYNERI